MKQIDFAENLKMLKQIHAFLEDESGATAIEYGLIAALVSVAAIGALTALGGSLNDMFNAVAKELCTATDGTWTPPAADGSTDGKCTPKT